MLPPLLRSAIPFLTVAFLAGPALLAQQPQPDAPAVDVNQMLKSLDALHTQGDTGVKALKQAAYQQVAAAAGSTDAAVALWQEAIRGTQMEGAGKEGTAFRAWRDENADVFKQPEVQSAISLNLSWLLLTLQRSNGMLVKDMVPTIISYTSNLLAHRVLMERFDERLKADQELAKGLIGPKREQQEKVLREDYAIKKMHDSVMQDVGSTVVAQWLKIGGFLSVEGWEGNPGDFDGIYENIVQPELRSELSPHVFDYWDAKLRTEADKASRSKLAYEIDKFNTLRRPELLWDRIQEYLYLGQVNRGATEMYNHIKTYSTHPDAQDWIDDLKKLIAPPPPTAATPAPIPGVTIPASAAAPAAR